MKCSELFSSLSNIFSRKDSKLKTIEMRISKDRKILTYPKDTVSFTLVSIPTSCEVRNELNGERGGQDVAHTMPDKAPYMPRPFPVGRWKIFEPASKVDAYMAPFFIPTDANQTVPIWILDEHGAYLQASGRTVIDEGYGIHHSISEHTLGCLKIMEKSDLEALVKAINHFHAEGYEVFVTQE